MGVGGEGAASNTEGGGVKGANFQLDGNRPRKSLSNTRKHNPNLLRFANPLPAFWSHSKNQNRNLSASGYLRFVYKIKGIHR